MAFPNKFLRLFVPILCTLCTATFFYNFVVLHNHKYPIQPPSWVIGAPPGDLNLTLQEYFQLYFSPSGSSPPPRQYIPECDCERPWIYHYQKQPGNTNPLNSTCSDPGTQFSPNQKVVSFSMYFFDDPFTSTNPAPKLYKEGLQVNLAAMRRNYPGYTIRLHTNIPKDPSFCSLYCTNPDLFWCDIRYTPGNISVSKMFFTTWRFLPLGDPTVDLFLSRDLDSTLTEREAAVVKDWLNLPERKPIHLMRDKYQAHNAEILGGLWGAKNGYFPKMGEGKGKDTAEELAKDIRTFSKVVDFKSFKDTGFDQRMLKKNVFDKRRSQIVAYDSYHCKEWRGTTMIRGFPMQRKDRVSDFVGNVDFGRVKYQLKPCPVKCRPEWGKDWEYC